MLTRIFNQSILKKSKLIINKE